MYLLHHHGQRVCTNIYINSGVACLVGKLQTNAMGKKERTHTFFLPRSWLTGGVELNTACSPPVVLKPAAVAAAVVGGGKVEALQGQRQHEDQREHRQASEDLAELVVHVLRVKPACIW